MPILADYFIVVSVPIDGKNILSSVIKKRKTSKRMEWNQQFFSDTQRRIIRSIVSQKTHPLFKLRMEGYA